ncbi:MAG: hypothetical protein J5781_01660, partial [Clostridia bacterium]|nr:hypothetical protein [Clostridia bacterium]
MKKILLITVIVLASLAMVLSLSACNSRNAKITVEPCWADNETLVYSIYDANNNVAPKVGTLTIELKANVGDDAKTLLYNEEERSYPSANVRVRESLSRENEFQIETTILASDYTVLATNKVYTDLNTADGNDSYTLQSYHDGNNYVYRVFYADGREGKSGKIKVGSSNYTDNEFLYYYVRCYKTDSVPSKTKIADPINNKAVEVSCSNGGTVTVQTEIQDTAKKIHGTVSCNKVTISLTDTPKGSGINV